jgi:hypothetical protein
MRSSICKSLAELIKQNIDGVDTFSNLYNQVFTKNLNFSEVKSYPTCTVTPGPSSREYLPSSQVWNNLVIYIRLYIKDETDPEGALELLIRDIENLIDEHPVLEYNVTNKAGKIFMGLTTDTQITLVTTDEGVLKPLGFGEIQLRVTHNNILGEI